MEFHFAQNVNFDPALMLAERRARRKRKNGERERWRGKTHLKIDLFVIILLPTIIRCLTFYNRASSILSPSSAGTSSANIDCDTFV